MFSTRAAFHCLAVVLVVLGTVAAQAPVFGQCGGQGFTGPTICAAGSTCVEQNSFFFQCLPASQAPVPTSSAAGAAPTSLSAIPTSTLHQITNFGTNPNNVGMFVYKPARPQAKPPLIVASHFCTGTAQIYFEGSKFAQLAETFGYLVLFPSSPHPDLCWDVSSAETLTHNGGSDSLSIANAARFAIANWGVDPNRVFAVGTSSGAMMTSVLAGAYPDIFKAGVVDSGVAFGCFSSPGPLDTFNEVCASGNVIMTGQQWAQLVFNAFPGFTGPRPKIQTWHGTVDTTVFVQNFFEQIKQWTTVFGYPSTPISNVSEPSLPQGYSNATFGPNFQAILAQGVGHTVPLFEQQYLEFFGIA
ncbi:Carbohydrate-Binding Module Family 1 / Carbohydrate Esterase Family 1 protein [Trametes cinnabarina]|uniref:Carbohydrate-Binding Module Family 1 / Carbohydrate Esterase Family 1 protein n=1 Tax=Pycnoporus cinnabarinus TaxID=5643 RepID=A0A060SJV2_PYCCI|nr:Carbohydrate-Binding Module Family 1 / Carbohydrate Esterase Family 1 protein [Trametes cinnabarina]